MAPIVAAFRAMWGVAFLTAVTLVVEARYLRRFDNPRQLMAFLGLVPSECSTGDARHRGGITKIGNTRGVPPGRRQASESTGPLPQQVPEIA
jgi:transposase